MFFIIAQLIMGSMIWLVLQETFTRRPWKDFQLRWFETERARAVANLEGEKDWLKVGTFEKEVNGEKQELEIADRLAELEKHIQEMTGATIDGPKRVEFEQLKAELAAAEVALKDQEILLAFAKADEDEYYYYYRDAKHHGDAQGEAKFGKALEEKRAHVAEVSKAYDAATAVRDGISDKVGAIQGDILKAKKEVADLRDAVSAAERAVAAMDSRFTGVEAMISNDGRIEQFWNQSIDLVDRCHTCHMGFDKCGFSRPEHIVDAVIRENLTEETAKRRFCITRAEAKKYVDAATKIKDSWGSDEEITFEKLAPSLGLEQDPVLVAAAANKQPAEEANALYRTHPRFDALIGNHPSPVFGCTTCHYGQGRQTKGVGLNLLIGETAPFDHARRDHYWISQMLDTKNHQVEASCFNCHQREYDLPHADHLGDGRKLVEHIGCTGCHPIGVLDPERKHGPALTKVMSKADPAWLLNWIQYPRGIRPRTRMPNFWPNALDAKGQVDPQANRCDEFEYERGAPYSPARYGNCAELRERESAYILAYLTKRSKPVDYPELPATASAERGKEVFESIGCRGCHNLGEWNQASTMAGSKERDLAPNLTGIGDKVKDPGWFYEWVRNPKSYWHETRMPRLRLEPAEAWDVAAYLASQTTDHKYEISAKAQAYINEPASDEKGRKLIYYYGCFGCHEIEGFETSARIGADLTEFGSKLPSKLDFGDVPEFTGDPHAQTWDNWIHKKLQDPRVYRYERASVRMPQFDLTKAEVESVVLFLKSQNDALKGWPTSIKRQLTTQELAMQRGAYMIDAYNCRGCHMIDDRGIDVDGDRIPDGGDLYRLLADNDDEKFRAPPKLIREGAKVYPEWLFKFLKAPFKLRENYKIRMPTFDFTDKQADDLVAYFAAKANMPYPYVERKRDLLSSEDRATADKLFAEAQCTNCHALGSGGNADPKNVAPNLRLAAERLQYDWLFHWLKNPQEQAPGVGMPNFFSPIDDKPGEYETPLTDLANGDWKRQIELLRALVIELGEPSPAAVAQAGAGPAPRRKR